MNPFFSREICFSPPFRKGGLGRISKGHITAYAGNDFKKGTGHTPAPFFMQRYDCLSREALSASTPTNGGN
jgi:hypothetical protein